MLDIAVLATTAVTSFLVPYFQKGMEQVAAEVTQNVSETAAEHATDVTAKIWSWVKSAFSSDQDEAILAEFKEDPEAAAPLVQSKLKKKLEQDPQLAQELQKLINAPSPDGKGKSWQIMHANTVGVIDAPGGHFTGTTAAVMINRSKPHAPSPSSSAPPPENTTEHGES